jgi:hypothetical protein
MLALAGCADPADSNPPELDTESQESRRTVRASFTGTLVTPFAVPLGCTALNGTAFVADPSGNTQGTTITTSDCHWSSATQQCECTVTLSQ